MTIQEMRLNLLQRNFILEEEIIEPGIININLFKYDTDNLIIGSESPIEEEEFMDASFYISDLKERVRGIEEHIAFRHSSNISECEHIIHIVDGTRKVCRDCMAKLGIQIVLDLKDN